jgi:hypothetical protein
LFSSMRSKSSGETRYTTVFGTTTKRLNFASRST